MERCGCRFGIRFAKASFAMSICAVASRASGGVIRVET
jgi:hypothetical protein